ncbi:MAG: carbohydrate kinase family protein [Planctomycetota bacterium]|jgi:ribokinase
MIERTFDVFGLGQCALDYLGKIEAYPPPDAKCEFTGMVVQGGGPVATALVALSRWGIPCTFAGVLGYDGFGTLIRATLEEEGVDTRGLLVRDGASSQFAFIVAEPDGRRTIFWQRPTGPPPWPGELDLSLLQRVKVLHTDGMFPEASLAAAAEAKKAGVRVSVDAGSMREGMLDLARSSDFFIASSAFARTLLDGEDDPLAACRTLAALGPDLVAVTRGEAGYVAILDGRVIDRPAYPVEAVDTTGCGDVFHAGFLFGMLSGWEGEKSLDFGAWAASRVALQLGGRAGIPAPSDWKGPGSVP